MKSPHRQHRNLGNRRSTLARMLGRVPLYRGNLLEGNLWFHLQCMQSAKHLLLKVCNMAYTNSILLSGLHTFRSKCFADCILCRRNQRLRTICSPKKKFAYFTFTANLILTISSIGGFYVSRSHYYLVSKRDRRSTGGQNGEY